MAQRVFQMFWAICARIFYPRTLKISPISSHLESFGLHFIRRRRRRRRRRWLSLQEPTFYII